MSGSAILQLLAAQALMADNVRLGPCFDAAAAR
jgi:hypothetical protein